MLIFKSLLLTNANVYCHIIKYEINWVENYFFAQYFSYDSAFYILSEHS